MTNPSILYDNRFADSTILAASDTDTGFAVANIVDWRTYTLWQSNSTGTKTITIDTGNTAAAADTLGIISHNLGSIGSTLSVQYSTDNFVSETTLTSAINPTTNDKLIYKEFSSAAARYWRLTINTATTKAKAGVVVLGSRTKFPNAPRIPTVPSRTGIVVDTKRSQEGNLLGSAVRYKPVTNQYSFPASTSSTSFLGGEYQTFWDDHGSNMKPFFFALDTGNLTTDIYFSRLTPGSQKFINREDLTLTGEWQLSIEGIKE